MRRALQQSTWSGVSRNDHSVERCGTPHYRRADRLRASMNTPAASASSRTSAIVLTIVPVRVSERTSTRRISRSEGAADQDRRNAIEPDPGGQGLHGRSGSVSGQPAADRAAGEREEDVGDPVHSDHVALDPDREHRHPGGAEPGGAPPQPDEHRTEPGAEHERTDEPRVDAHLGVRRLAGLDPHARARRVHARISEAVALRVVRRRRGCRRAGCGGGWTSTSRRR